MTITKYEHACLLIEEQGKRVVVDPGQFTTTLGHPDNVVALVITHVHGDHLDELQIQELINLNPDMKIFSTQEVAEALPGMSVTIVRAGDKEDVAPFTLEFFGGNHALIHESIPRNQNVGVMVNNTLYYPGDSFVEPEGRSVPVLALPVAAPWMKVGEAIDFLIAIKPRRLFPTHDSVISDIGYGIHDRLLEGAAAKQGSEYTHLTPGQSINA